MTTLIQSAMDKVFRASFRMFGGSSRLVYNQIAGLFRDPWEELAADTVMTSQLR